MRAEVLISFPQNEAQGEEEAVAKRTLKGFSATGWGCRSKADPFANIQAVAWL